MQLVDLLFSFGALSNEDMLHVQKFDLELSNEKAVVSRLLSNGEKLQLPSQRLVFSSRVKRSGLTQKLEKGAKKMEVAIKLFKKALDFSLESYPASAPPIPYKTKWNAYGWNTAFKLKSSTEFPRLMA